MMKVILYLPAFFWLLPLTCVAKEETITQTQPVDPLVESACNFEAFVNENDPKGLNVREKPDANSKILGTIPPAVPIDPGSRFTIKPELKVLGSKNGWFKIEGAQDNNALLEDVTEIKSRKIYAGIGWVSGKMLTIKSQSKHRYALPSVKSKIPNQNNDTSSFDSNIERFKLLGCVGDWAQVEDMEMKKDNRYWLNQICGIQETSCDGLGNDGQ